MKSKWFPAIIDYLLEDFFKSPFRQVGLSSHEEEEEERQDEGALESEESEVEDEHASVRQPAVGKGFVPSITDTNI